jgi:hypothetical protein
MVGDRQILTKVGAHHMRAGPRARVRVNVGT